MESEERFYHVSLPFSRWRIYVWGTVRLTDNMFQRLQTWLNFKAEIWSLLTGALKVEHEDVVILNSSEGRCGKLPLNIRNNMSFKWEVELKHGREASNTDRLDS